MTAEPDAPRVAAAEPSGCPRAERHRRLLAVFLAALTLGLLALTSGLAPASAAAAVAADGAGVPDAAGVSGPLDAASDNAALDAYRQYAATLVDGTAAASRRADAFAALVADGCSGVLAPLDALAPNLVSRAALLDLGGEVEDDVAIEFDSVALPAFSRFAATLRGLRWTSNTTTAAIAQLLAAMRTSLTLRPSGLCADARTLTESALVEPPGTRALLRAYANGASAVSRRLAPFLQILERFETPSEAGVIAAADRLVNRYQALAGADQGTVSRRIDAVLSG